jgi:hypothetical protein
LGALLAASACVPEAPPAAAHARDSAAEPAPPASETKAVSAPAEGSAARRCGWLANPTPGNWWLTDSEREWILATQGGEPVAGIDDMPDMSTAGWVETNGHYGYGCACMTIAVDPATRRVTRVADPQPRPLKQCRADRALPRP